MFYYVPVTGKVYQGFSMIYRIHILQFVCFVWFLCVSVCLSMRPLDYLKSIEMIFVKLLPGVCLWPRTNPLLLGISQICMRHIRDASRAKKQFINFGRYLQYLVLYIQPDKKDKYVILTGECDHHCLHT